MLDFDDRQIKLYPLKTTFVQEALLAGCPELEQTHAPASTTLDHTASSQHSSTICRAVVRVCQPLDAFSYKIKDNAYFSALVRGDIPVKGRMVIKSNADIKLKPDDIAQTATGTASPAVLKDSCKRS